MTTQEGATESFGANAWLVDEMHERYLDDPKSVAESWRDFFADYSRDGGDRVGDRTAAQATEPRPVAEPPRPSTPPAAGPAAEQQVPPSASPIRGAAARIVANMEASLAVPTATSVRDVPARLLEVNRKVVNGYLSRTGGGKVSFTHVIGYAIVRAVEDVPVMNSSFSEVDGKPMVTRHEHIGLGLAVDVEKSDGSRTLLVPCIKDADTLDFKGFWTAYEEIIRRVRGNKISPDDFTGTTISITNPGTIGTVHSVPRLMPGQGLIVGVRAVAYPAEYEAAGAQMLAQLGVPKVMTLTFSHHHR